MLAPSNSKVSLSRDLVRREVEAELAWRCYLKDPSDWRAWLAAMYPEEVVSGFGEHHETHWEWVWALERGVRPPSMLDVWARGGGKSTTGEISCVAVGALGKRSYGLYISATQDQADDHVGSVESLLSSRSVSERYPLLGERRLTKYGASAGWRRNRLRTGAGFTLDAAGLDKGFRGLKDQAQRPDFLIFDDVDDELDSPVTTEKKILAITRKGLPAGAADLAILFVQNVILEDGVVGRLAGVSEYSADFLKDRILNGPIPAVYDLEYEERDDKIRITGGTASWGGQDIEACEAMIKDMGLQAFLSECQHEVEAPPGSLVYRRSRVSAAMERGNGLELNPNATQILALDPGFARRACLLAIQERSDDRIETWKEWSFTRCDDDYIARIAAGHCLEHRVSSFYYDAESPEQAAAVKKHLRRLARERGIRRKDIPTRFSKVAFGTYKRYAIHITRWLLEGPAVAWGAEETEAHLNNAPEGIVPGIFRREMRSYRLEPGTEDPVKEKDHGPDAWHAYAPRWLTVWLKTTGDKGRVRALVEEEA